jgi:biopolymer transport protein TolR
VVSINREGEYFVSVGENPDQPLDARTLVNRVQAVLGQRRDQTVYIKGDRQANYGQVVEVMALLQQSGVTGLGLVTRSPDESRD